MASLDPRDGLIFMALPQESQGLFEARGFQIHYTGLGKLKAALTASQNIQKRLRSAEQPQLKWVLNLGTAGSHTISQGSLVECTQFVERDPIFEVFKSPLLETKARTNLQSVTCGSADMIHFEKPKIACDVYDMEAYALALVCQSHQLDFISLKFVTDSSDQKLIADWKKNLRAASKSLLAALENLIKK